MEAGWVRKPIPLPASWHTYVEGGICPCGPVALTFTSVCTYASEYGASGHGKARDILYENVQTATTETFDFGAELAEGSLTQQVRVAVSLGLQNSGEHDVPRQSLSGSLVGEVIKTWCEFTTYRCLLYECVSLCACVNMHSHTTVRVCWGRHVLLGDFKRPL